MVERLHFNIGETSRATHPNHPSQKHEVYHDDKKQDKPEDNHGQNETELQEIPKPNGADTLITKPHVLGKKHRSCRLICGRGGGYKQDNIVFTSQRVG